MAHYITKIAGVKIPPEFGTSLRDAREYYLRLTEGTSPKEEGLAGAGQNTTAKDERPVTTSPTALPVAASFKADKLDNEASKVLPTSSASGSVKGGHVDFSYDEVAAVAAFIGSEFSEILRGVDAQAKVRNLSKEEQFKLYEIAKSRVDAEYFHKESLLFPAIRVAEDVQRVLSRALFSRIPTGWKCGEEYQFSDYFKVIGNPRFCLSDHGQPTVFKELEKIWLGDSKTRAEHKFRQGWTAERLKEELEPRLDTLKEMLTALRKEQVTAADYQLALRTLRKILPEVERCFYEGATGKSDVPAHLRPRSIFERENGPVPTPINSNAAKVTGMGMPEAMGPTKPTSENQDLAS